MFKSEKAPIMRIHLNKLRHARYALAASALALLAIAPSAQAEPTPVPAGAPFTSDSSYQPTMADYQGVYDALQRYRMGLEMHDQQMQDSAFWDAPKPMRPPPGAGPGAGLGPPPNFDELRKMPGFVEVWHLPMDSYIHFDSPTRARHFGYFLSVYPQPEKKVENAGALPNASSARSSIVGWPGYYDDILEKRNGEWRILERKTKINQVRTNEK
jgi:hypothetical protein